MAALCCLKENATAPLLFAQIQTGVPVTQHQTRCGRKTSRSCTRHGQCDGPSAASGVGDDASASAQRSILTLMCATHEWTEFVANAGRRYSHHMTLLQSTCTTKSASICKFDENEHHCRRRRNTALLKPLYRSEPAADDVLRPVSSAQTNWSIYRVVATRDVQIAVRSWETSGRMAAALSAVNGT